MSSRTSDSKEWSTSTDSPSPPPIEHAGEQSNEHPKDAQFWLIFLALSLVTLLAALDTSIVSTALPTITSALNSEELFVWTVNAYLLACTVTGPIFAQASNIFGRRHLTILAVVLFAAGSAICGAAPTTSAMLAGRALQGIGGGGIATMTEIVVCDIVSLRERGLYAGIMGGVWAIATVIGPILGGAFAQHVSWRWIFYINLPIAGIALALLIVLLHLRHPYKGTLIERLALVDWLGNTILALAVTSILLALTWAGTTHPWSSWRTIVPLVLGFLGLFGFMAYEASPRLQEPTVPPRLFQNRTSTTVFAMSFLHSMLLFWACYFLPVYFQAVLAATPTRSAIMLFPIATTTAPAGILAGALITRTGRYRIWHFAGFALMTLSCGLFALLDERSSTARWAGVQLPFGVGAGLVFTSCLPPILASLPERDVATATGAWTFLRNFGSVWGTAVPAAVFNARTDAVVAASPRIADDPALRRMLAAGGAYEHATKAFVDSFRADPELLAAVKAVYVAGLRRVWLVAIAFAGLAFVLSFLVKTYRLRDQLNTEYGMDVPSPRREDSREPLARKD